MRFLIKYRIALIFSLCAALVYTHFFLNRAYVELRISTEVKTDFKIYWAGEGEDYAEKRMVRISIGPQKENFAFFLTDLRKAHKLRIDPFEKGGSVYFKSLRISQYGLPPIEMSEPKEFAQLVPLGGVYSTGYTIDGWEIQSLDKDPRFQLEVKLPPRTLNWPAEVARFLLLLGMCLGAARVLSPLWANYTYTTYQGVFALGLILTMAVVSKVDHHPDERVHIAATKYYESHWMPPSVESPEILDSYSDFGVSRLNSMEVSYFFAGKFARLFQLFHLDQAVSYRLFNVALFSILVLAALANVKFRLFFIPMLLSPQIWYIFSYINSDAFSLFVVLLSGWQMVDTKSAFNRFLSGRQLPLLKILGVAFLLALLIFVKKTFYFFTLFLLLFFAWRCLYHPLADTRAMLKKLLILCCVGFVFAGVRIGADIQVNGMGKGEKVRVMQELRAKPMFKPSTPIEEKFNYLLLRDRGYSYWDTIKVLRWGEKSFRSGFGAYGYMTVMAHDSYYDLARVLALAGLLFMGISIVIRGQGSEKVLFACALLCSIGLIAKASHFAWTIDFQGQGRYFFPIVPIIGMLLVQTEKVYNQLLLRSLSFSMFLLSVFSFVFIGLFSLAKYGWG